MWSGVGWVQLEPYYIICVFQLTYIDKASCVAQWKSAGLILQ